MNTKKWLARKVNCPVEDIEKLYESEMAIDFLLVWTQFEIICFDGFFNRPNTNEFIESFIPLNELNESLANSHKKFYKRYSNNNNNIIGLFNFNDIDKIDEKFKGILEKDINTHTEQEKLYLILTVIGRYRNNLFHGNKGLSNWLSYKKIISRCTESMKSLIDLTLNETNS